MGSKRITLRLLVEKEEFKRRRYHDLWRQGVGLCYEQGKEDADVMTGKTICKYVLNIRTNS